MDGPIVAGADGSETSRLAILEAGALAKRNGQRVVVVFVRHPQPVGALAAASCFMVPPALVPTDDDHTIVEAQSTTILDPLGVPWCLDVRSGDPADELMRAARVHRADTIVVAGRRHGAWGNFAHAAVTARLLHRWPHSLLVVHPPAPDAETPAADPASRP